LAQISSLSIVIAAKGIVNASSLIERDIRCFIFHYDFTCLRVQIGAWTL
jgi:hypothetical protein